MQKKYIMTLAVLVVPFFLRAGTGDQGALKGLIEERISNEIKKYTPPAATVNVTVLDIDKAAVMDGAENITASIGDNVKTEMKADLSGTKNGMTVTASVRVKVETICSVITAARTIPAGTEITKQDIYFMNRNTAGLNFRPFFEDSGVVQGKIAARAVQSGKIISQADLEDRPAVLPGQHVKIVCNDELMKLETQGRAEEKGAMGDIIKVTNIASKKVIFARVISADTVEAGGDK
jgi:flagella basal body P-ring formation protein FlgA